MLEQGKTFNQHTPRSVNRTRAVVIGGSMAGLLAAHVLADHFDRVVILERDHFPGGPQPRAGLPHDQHVHILLMRGRRILECWFPDLGAEMISYGAHAVDMGQELAVLGFYGWQARYRRGHTMLTFTRPLLDWCVRRRLAKHARVCIIDGCRVTGFAGDAGGEAITGVKYRPRGKQASDAQVLRADLVVDSSGRFSRTPKWLSGLGYDRPRETVVNSFVGYSSRMYEARASRDTDWKALLLLGKPPDATRGGVLLPVEGGRWLVTLAGSGKDYPPTDAAGFLEYARALRSEVLYKAIRRARPVSSIAGHRATANRLRHYESLARWPDRLVVLGDAVCAFNPVYGQGISVAALGAEALNRTLARCRGRVAAQFQRELAKVNALPWLMATGDDFRWPQTEGERPSRLTGLLQMYLDEVIASATRSSATAAIFSQVAHLVQPPRRLFHPRIALQVLAHAVGRRISSRRGGA